jgi:hypothetical protein
MRRAVTNSDTNFFLNKLPTSKLEDLLGLSEEDQHYYCLQLIKRFYPSADKEEKAKLLKSYIAGFELEYLLRTEPNLAESFTCVYTKTGMIREVSNDIFFIPEAYQYQIN